ncbi:MAG: kojibiose phosphorylase [Puniceicoccaceae bacterium 5H]|nr:MAG: kojibiose phosphorylase [Puniceicoccaceae bacterium 5H]
MKTPTHTMTDPAWTLNAEDWNPDAITEHGNRFLLGNGHMGYRGTLEEFGPDERVGVLLPGVFDQVGDAWREPVNAPNGLHTRVRLNGRWLDPLEMTPIAHRQTLDLRGALHRRETQYQLDGVTVTVAAERFLSAHEVHLMAMRYTVAVDGPAEVTLQTGIDPAIWDLNGPHLPHLEASHAGDCILLRGDTAEAGHRVAVAQVACLSGDVAETPETVKDSRRSWTLQSDGALQLELQTFCAVYHSVEHRTGPVDQAANAHVQRAAARGYEAVRQDHLDTWEARWQQADVQIEGDTEAQKALRYSLYQLLSAAPFHAESLSIPARALSGQVYKGAVFWDTEIFMLPFFLATFPELARNLLRYRVHALPGAQAKAREYGYAGAFYAWESQDAGHEACTLFNVTDVFTGRPTRTYFRDKQIHISADIAWAFWRYVQVTGDLAFLWDGGWQVMLECARFFFSYAHLKSDQSHYVLLDVTGPDEYHERVHNNAYTNYMVAAALQSLLTATGRLEASDPQRFAQLLETCDASPEEIERLRDFSARLYCPTPDPETGVIEQFDGYLQLENCSLEALKSRLLDPHEYLGGGSGLATTTQILKQADVVLLLALMRDAFSVAIKRANWAFYEPRTEHGSSLSACAYGLSALDTGNVDYAYEYFLKTATIDLTGKSKQFVGPLYIGGTHPAANGGAWMVATEGFAGIRLREDGVHCQPHLPTHWQAISFSVCWRGQRLDLSMTRDGLTATAAEDNAQPIPFFVCGVTLKCLPGRPVTVPLG